MNRTRRLGLLNALLALGAAGCTEFASPEDELEPSAPQGNGSSSAADENSSDSDSATTPGEIVEPLQAGGDWSCLDETASAAVVEDTSRPLTYSFPIGSLVGAPLEGVQVRACRPADLTCANPVSDDLTPNSEGVVEVPLYYGFNGFFELEAADNLPVVYYLEGPMLEDRVDEITLLMTPPEAVGPIALASRTEFRPELGLLSIAVTDCQGVRAPGAVFSNSEGGTPFYFDDSLPSADAVSTDSFGAGGFANVPVGVVEVSAQVDGDRFLPPHRVVTRASSITQVRISGRR